MYVITNFLRLENYIGSSCDLQVIKVIALSAPKRFRDLRSNFLLVWTPPFLLEKVRRAQRLLKYSSEKREFQMTNEWPHEEWNSLIVSTSNS